MPSTIRVRMPAPHFETGASTRGKSSVAHTGCVSTCPTAKVSWEVLRLLCFSSGFMTTDLRCSFRPNHQVRARPDQKPCCRQLNAFKRTLDFGLLGLWRRPRWYQHAELVQPIAAVSSHIQSRFSGARGCLVTIEPVAEPGLRSIEGRRLNPSQACTCRTEFLRRKSQGVFSASDSPNGGGTKSRGREASFERAVLAACIARASSSERLRLVNWAVLGDDLKVLHSALHRISRRSRLTGPVPGEQ